MIETAASKSFTVRRAFPEAKRISPLVWLNLVCLDAPLVAVTWQMLFARSFGVAVAPGGTLALFLTAWLIYLADRFGDSLSLGKEMGMSLRQEFCLRHRFVWLGAIVVVALADTAVVLTQLDRSAVRLGAGVAAAALCYLLVNRLRPALWRILPLKEISIGFIFAAGTMVGLSRGLTSAVLPAWLLFACLCALNCISIAIWERELDQAQGRISIATEFPAIAAALIPLLGLLGLTSAAALLAWPHGIFIALIASSVLLALVHVLRARIRRDVRTALADLVLLAPLVVLVFA
ncbi:MAG: hypothetical protein M3Y86_08930 [Verrucomicrobiota bacterium]|nr:hypothetical protein [Verrucomicrobiota bacterium]